MKSSPGKRLFIILWLAGIIGVLSFLLVDLTVFIAALPVREGPPPPELPYWLIKLLSVVQPGILVTFAAAAGVYLSPIVGLRSPGAEAIAGRDSFWTALRPQIIPGIIAGTLSGIALVCMWVIVKPNLTADFIDRAERFNQALPHVVRILYGGVTEEILLRWGLMTVLVWLLWRVLQRSEDRPRAVYVVAGILISALVFGAGHLPVAYALAGELTGPLVVYVVSANSLFGIVAGFLYWRLGLEAAMIAHMFTHVVLIIAINLSF